MEKVNSCVAGVSQLNELSYKIENSIKLLRWYNDRFNPYHVAFSGGRDSVVLNWLCSQACINYRLYFYDNVLIPKVDRDFVKKAYPGCIIIKAKYNLTQLVRFKKILPTRLNRFCCEYWKECYGNGAIVLSGIRLDESYNRSFRHRFEFSRNSRHRFYKSVINPLAFFSNSNIAHIIKSNHLSLSDSYAFRNRNGCVGCPMCVTRRVDLYINFPKYRILWEKASAEVIKINESCIFKKSSELFEWWLSDLSIVDFFEVKKQNLLDFSL